MPVDEKTTSKFDDMYCIHCQNQQSGELANKEQVREGSIKAAMQFMGKTREEAEKMADAMMPKMLLLFGFRALYAFIFRPILNCWTASIKYNFYLLKTQIYTDLISSALICVNRCQ